MKLDLNNQLKFDFLIDLIYTSCKASQPKRLPPINWYNMANSWIKSELKSAAIEFKLIELTIMQITELNSAFNLIKNYLIDTNYFVFMDASSQRLVLENFHIICNQLNLTLLKKFLDKMKVYLTQHQVDLDQWSALLRSLWTYFKELALMDNEKQNELNNIKKEIIEFFYFFATSFNFNLDESFNNVRFFTSHY